MMDLLELGLLQVIAENTSPVPPAEWWTPTSFDLPGAFGFTLGVTDLTTFFFESVNDEVAGCSTIAFPFTANNQGVDIENESAGTLTTLTFPDCTTLFGLRLIADSGLTTVSFPSLTTVNGTLGGAAFAIQQCPLASLSVPLLATVDSTLAVDNSNLTVFSAPALTSVNGFFAVRTSATITSINLPNLVTTNFGFLVNGNTSLTTLNIGSYAPGPTQLANLIDCSNCALNAASVNLMLHRCVVSGLTGCTINLSGGTSSPPTGQGIIDAATLSASGNTVSHN